ncbi:cytochrome P450 [Nocardia sp. NPDC020380]|uniref:cytochrome P450 n=1 Tax=Nocardia sp. NPDC020380 TaxID=3364309 RepID=UPI0037913364
MTDSAATDLVEEVGDDFFDDPHRYYRRWREGGPVKHIRMPDGWESWVVLGYNEARTALTDPRVRKGVGGLREIAAHKGYATNASSDARMLGEHMLNSDPPDHTRLRKLVVKAFTPRRTAELKPRIEELTNALLDDLEGKGEVDLLAAFANPLPVQVICELLGIPFEDRASFQYWTKVLVGLLGDQPDREKAAAEMAGYLRAQIAAKHAHPGDDLLSALVHASEDGDALTESEVIAMSFLLLVAGHETTVNLIGNGTYNLLRNPSQLDLIRADPATIPNAIEEFLRHDGPVSWATLRYTAEPIRLGPTEIPAGEYLFVALGAANHDPTRYPHSDTLDITADTSAHIAFGYGIHYCVGAPLARLEATTAFTALLTRYPHLRLADQAFTPTWQANLVLRGLAELPVILSP